MLQLCRLIPISLVVALLLQSAAAQSSIATAVPRSGDPEVYASFFYFHDDFAKWIEERTKADNTHGMKLTQTAGALQKIQVTELPTVTTVSREVIKDLAKVQADRRKFVDQSKTQKKTPDPSTLREYQLQRNLIILSGVLKLRRTLSPASWAGLDSYINTQHRLRIHQISAPSK